MRSVIRNPKDFWSGLIMVASGVAFLSAAYNYDLGETSRIGPGFFPMVLAALLIVIGASVAGRGFLSEGDRIRNIAIKPMLLIVGATLVFALLVRAAGLALASTLLVVIAALASPLFKWREAALLALGLAVLCCVVFVFVLGLPIPVIGRF
jgi:putative tricarboxylic transport membrane protein